MPQNIWKKALFSTSGNSSLAYQEVVSDVVSGPPNKKIRSLAAAIINAVDNANFTEKLTITQEEGYISYSTTHGEE